MIDAKSLVLNKATPANASSSGAVGLDMLLNLSSQEESMNTSINTGLEPNAFMLLLSQVIAGSEPSTDNTEQLPQLQDANVPNDALEIAPDPSLAAELSLVANPSSLPQDIITTSSENQTLDDVLLTTNPAVAWLNTEHFQQLNTSTSLEENALITDDIGAGFASIADEDVLANPVLKQLSSNEAVDTAKETKTASTDILPALAASDDQPDEGALANRFLGGKYKDDLQNFAALAAGASRASKQGVDAGQEEQTAPLVQTNITPSVALAMDNHPDNAASQAVKTFEITSQMGTSAWANKFSEHVTWLGQHQEVKSAIIKVHPEELGPLEISVKVVKDTATVTIASHNGAVRDLVDQAVPRLRDMMAEQGLNLADVHVGVGPEANRDQYSKANSEEQN